MAALIVTLGEQSSNELDWKVLVPIASVAFQSSGQAVTSRVMQYAGMTSVVLTSTYCDLFGDANLFSASNVERNRRAAAPICLLSGVIFGGLWAHSDVGLRGALWTAVALKGLVVIAWIIWPAEPDFDDD